MKKLTMVGENSFRVNNTKEFVCNGILTRKNVKGCFDFAYGMTFGRKGAHRDHRSGGGHRRRNGEVFVNTFQGKLAEFAVFNHIRMVGKMDIEPPNMDMMGLSEWDSFDIDINGSKINIKSTKRYGNLLLLEVMDWDIEGMYIHGCNGGCREYDYFVQVRIDPDLEMRMRFRDILYADLIGKDELEVIILSERWRANIVGFMTRGEFVQEVIGEEMILPRGSVLNGSTRMDAGNYYAQSGDLHDISELITLLKTPDDEL